MARIATSIEESKRLLELGIGKNTADMCHEWIGSDDVYSLRIGKCYDVLDIPAWSLGALIIIISNIEPQRFSFVFCSDVDNWVGDFIEYGYGRKVTRMDDDLISLCVNMIQGLVNEGYIKGKENKE